MDERDRELGALAEKFADRTVQANYALWNALLTVDGLLISVFIVSLGRVAPKVKWILVPIILLSVISAGLLISIFRATRDNMKYHGELLTSGRVFEMSPEEKEADILRAVREHNAIKSRENAVYVVTFLQGLCIIGLVLCVTLSHHESI
jgi:hypothetical protein